MRVRYTLKFPIGQNIESILQEPSLTAMANRFQELGYSIYGMDDVYGEEFLYVNVICGTLDIGQASSSLAEAWAKVLPNKRVKVYTTSATPVIDNRGGVLTRVGYFLSIDGSIRHPSQIVPRDVSRVATELLCDGQVPVTYTVVVDGRQSQDVINQTALQIVIENVWRQYNPGTSLTVSQNIIHYQQLHKFLVLQISLKSYFCFYVTIC